MVAHWTSPTATRDVNDPRWSSGTSFAAPLVAGVAARRLQLFLENNEQMCTRLVNDATSDAHGLNLLDRGPGSPNRLLYAYTNCKSRVCCSP
jgi:subtilisin family serine protease